MNGLLRRQRREAKQGREFCGHSSSFSNKMVVVKSFIDMGASLAKEERDLGGNVFDSSEYQQGKS